jgi:ABC-type uncharacterized transport system auxiliary subunit
LEIKNKALILRTYLKKITPSKMKKVFAILAASAMLAIVACGPSAEEKKKAEEKRIQDSIEAATRNADSLAALEASMMPDSAAVSTDSAATTAPAN